MELAGLHDEELKPFAKVPFQSSKNKSIFIDLMIQPWGNNNFSEKMHQTIVSHRKGSCGVVEKEHNQRRKTIQQRIEQTYRKYSKEGMEHATQKQKLISRQNYREKLKEFEKTSDFRQMGIPKLVEQSMPDGVEKYSLQLLKYKPNNVHYCCDYKQQKIKCQSPKKYKNDEKNTDKFQKMLRIKDKIRKKNSITVSKLKQKYHKDYQSVMIYSQKQIQTEQTSIANREKAKMKIRLRSLCRSKNHFEQPQDKCTFQVKGTCSNAFQYNVERSFHNFTSSATRSIQKCAKLQVLNKTFHSFRK